MEGAFTTIHYRCEQCGAFDSDRFRVDEAVPARINCYKCHAGQDKSKEQMAIGRVGMRQLTLEEAVQMRPECFPVAKAQPAPTAMSN